MTSESRSTRTRVAHAVLFEIIGLAMIVPLGAIGFHIAIADTAIVAITLSLAATGWNYLYNVLFDRALKQRYGTIRKSLVQRILHAILFEIGLLTITVPFVAWYLEIGLWEAFVIDIAMAGFYLVYAFIFNWAWDALTLRGPAMERAEN